MERMIWENLIPEVMKECLLDILHPVRLTEYLKNELNGLKKAFMLYLMKMESGRMMDQMMMMM